MSTNEIIVEANVSIARWSSFLGDVERFVETVREWRHRARSRRELARLSYDQIKDIPNRFELETERSKPFWQA